MFSLDGFIHFNIFFVIQRSDCKLKNYCQNPSQQLTIYLRNTTLKMHCCLPLDQTLFAVILVAADADTQAGDWTDSSMVASEEDRESANGNQKFPLGNRSQYRSARNVSCHFPTIDNHTLNINEVVSIWRSFPHYTQINWCWCTYNCFGSQTGFART